MMKMRLSAQAAKALEAAGWFPGRRIHDLVAAWAAQLDRAGGFQMFPAAAKP
jgi:hypothetical protein